MNTKRCILLFAVSTVLFIATPWLFFSKTYFVVHASSTVTITIDNGTQYQTIEGFGTTHESLVYGGGVGDTLGINRSKAIEAVYKQVGITMGNISGGLLESPGDYSQRANDNNDPSTINWSGFNKDAANNMKNSVIDLAAPFGFNNYYLGQTINVRWASPWLSAIRSSDYNRYLDEASEQVVAGHIYWRNTFGIVPKYTLLYNEPTTGNDELAGGSTQELVDLVKRVGNKLRQAGFSSIKFVVPSQETIGSSLSSARAILADPEARQYVGAIAYHPYPYGSPYSSVPNILNASGQGNPVSSEISVRQQLKALAEQYGLSLWMTEVSHGYVDPRSFDDLRGRAIHIHDELIYANASAYFAMGNMWDTTSQQMHFGNNNLFDPANEGGIVMVDNPSNTVYITGMGYAIGHYARWIKKGDKRIDVLSSDPLLQITAFRSDSQNTLILVIINNGNSEKTLNINLQNIAVNGQITGERSTANAYWQSVNAFSPQSPTTITTTIPGQSVTTYVAPFSNNTIVQPTPTPTPTPTYTPGDINRDSRVDIFDYNIFISDFGKTNVSSDINNDGKVDIFDYNILVGNFGR